ncbi:MAG: hypothetical protein ACFCU5_10035 [Pleurocapsa sp.]
MVTKYRKPVLTPEMISRAKTVIENVLAKFFSSVRR